MSRTDQRDNSSWVRPAVLEPPGDATDPDDWRPLRVNAAGELLTAPAGDGGGLTNAELRLTPVEVIDDNDSFQSFHQILVASTDTLFTFAQPVRLVRVTNWDTAARVLVKDAAIATDVDANASRLGKAPAADIPNSDWWPYVTATIHLRSAADAEVTVEGFYAT